jgi:hypothetical protein
MARQSSKRHAKTLSRSALGTGILLTDDFTRNIREFPAIPGRDKYHYPRCLVKCMTMLSRRQKLLSLTAKDELRYSQLG